MRLALLNPAWSFDGSVYFGCREPHLPLELGYAAELLRLHGHDVALIDAHLMAMSLSDVRAELASFSPDVTVVTTAPSYLFWRCAPPELRVPMQVISAIRDCGGEIVVVGPHASTTPKITLEKLDVRFAIQGECEEALVELADSPVELWPRVEGVASRLGRGKVHIEGGPRAVNVRELPALEWSKPILARHAHHHHRFERAATGPGAEVESSRGCPFSCTFCAKENFRNKFRQRPLETVLRKSTLS
ncbi:MAG: cobalamin-dependent protein [Polyangiaceae bacterium]